MNWLVIALRLVHIGSGALCVGMMAFNVVFLMPALRDAGPDGAKVMAALQRRGVMTVMPIVALLTLISGIWLFWRFSGGSHAVLATPMGLALAFGAVASLIGFALGIGLMRPAMLRAAALAQSLAGLASEQERQARSAELQRLRARGAGVAKLTTVLLVLALGAMAVARYL